MDKEKYIIRIMRHEQKIKHDMALGLGIILCINIIPMAVAEMGLEMRVANDIFDEYDPGIRPIKDKKEPINVTIKFKLYQIVELDDTSESLTAINWISMYWIDPLLKWNSSDYGGIDMIYVPSSRIWRPDITIYNGLYEESQDLRLYDSFNAKISNTGFVYWSFRAMIKTSCVFRLAEFPWDTQICNLTMGSWLYDTRFLTIKADSDFVDLAQYQRNALWDMVRAPIVTSSILYPCCPLPFQEITLYYILRRNGLYFCFNILFPSTLLLGITLLSFLIPIESGEKISIPVTMFLSQSFLLFAITQYMPVQSDVIPAIGPYAGLPVRWGRGFVRVVLQVMELYLQTLWNSGYILLGIMMLIGLSILCNISVCYVYFKCHNAPPSIRMLRLLYIINKKDFRQNDQLQVQNQLLDKHDEINLEEKSPSRTNAGHVHPGRNEVGNARYRGNSKGGCGLCPKHCINNGDRDTRICGSEKWKDVARRLNHILCIGTLFATFAFGMAIMAIYMRNRRNTEKQFSPDG